MSELGELLVLLHGARDRCVSVRAALCICHHVARSHEAMQRAARRSGATLFSPAR